MSQTILWCCATAAEASSRRGSDNVSVPLVTAFMLWYMMHHAPDASLMLAVGTALGGLVAVLSWRAGLLTGSGAVATFWLAVPVFGFGGWMWTAPMVTFFLLSSLLSKVGRRVKAQYDLMFEKGDRRDWAQVVANGGIAGGLIERVRNPNPSSSIVNSGSPPISPHRRCCSCHSRSAQRWP